MLLPAVPGPSIPEDMTMILIPERDEIPSSLPHVPVGTGNGGSGSVMNIPSHMSSSCLSQAQC